MSDKKTDGRIKYTKMVIRNSFISLLKEKPLAKISVTEICRGADINRATFYAHYTDPFALLCSIEADMIADITEKLGNTLTVEDPSLKDGLTRVFEYIGDNAEICSVLLSDGSDVSYQSQVAELIKKQFMGDWTAEKCKTKEDAEYLFVFIVIGSMGIIRKWLDEGMEKPPDQMAELIIMLSSSGYSAF